MSRVETLSNADQAPPIPFDVATRFPIKSGEALEPIEVTVPASSHPGTTGRAGVH